jgi:hypothetical protein
VTRTLLVFSDLYEILLGPDGLPRIEDSGVSVVEAVYGLTGLYVADHEIRHMGKLADGSELILACPPGVAEELVTDYAWTRFYPLADSVHFPVHGLPAFTAEAVHRVDDDLLAVRFDIYVSRALVGSDE